MKKNQITALLIVALLVVLNLGTVAQSKNPTPVWDYEDTSLITEDKYANLGQAGGAYSIPYLLTLWGLETPVPEEEVRIGFVGKCLENEFWSSMKQGCEDVQRQLVEAGFDNVKIRYDSPVLESDTEGQISVMQNMVNQGYDAIIAAPITDSNLAPVIEQALAAGITVLPFATFFNEEPYVGHYFGNSPYMGGRLAAQTTVDLLDGRTGTLAIITGIASNTTAIGRTEAFADYFEEHGEGLGLKVVSVQNANWNRDAAYDIATTVIKQNPDLVGIYCNNDTMAMGAIEALREAGKIGEIILGGTDGTEEALQSIMRGELDYTIATFDKYHAWQTFQVLFHLLNGEDVPERVFSILEPVTKWNVPSNEEEILSVMKYGRLKFMSQSDYNELIASKSE